MYLSKIVKTKNRDEFSSEELESVKPTVWAWELVSIPPTIVNYCSDTKITRKTIQFKNPLSHSFIVAPNNAQLLRYCPPERKAIIAARSACFSLFIPLFILVCSFAGSFWLKTQRAQLPARRHPIKPLTVYLAALVVGIYWDFSMCCFKVRYDVRFPRGGLSLKGTTAGGARRHLSCAPESV